MAFEWTELTFQQEIAGNTAILVFPICVVLVSLVLAAKYESLFLPLAIILIVPMCLLSAIIGVWLNGATTTSSPRSASSCSRALRA
jgi:multidrug efflux pump